MGWETLYSYSDRYVVSKRIYLLNSAHLDNCFMVFRVQTFESPAKTPVPFAEPGCAPGGGLERGVPDEPGFRGAEARDGRRHRRPPHHVERALWHQ